MDFVEVDHGRLFSAIGCVVGGGEVKEVVEVSESVDASESGSGSASCSGRWSVGVGGVVCSGGRRFGVRC
jgi:hypothetical protein